jgi:hypothetical protein
MLLFNEAMLQIVNQKRLMQSCKTRKENKSSGLWFLPYFKT